MRRNKRTSFKQGIPAWFVLATSFQTGDLRGQCRVNGTRLSTSPPAPPVPCSRPQTSGPSSGPGPIESTARTADHEVGIVGFIAGGGEQSLIGLPGRHGAAGCSPAVSIRQNIRSNKP